MSKIFGIGLARTGNASLCAALNILGYNTIHFPRTLKEIDYHAAAVDTSVAVGYKFLDLMYPGSKFIFTDRARASWLNSCQRYWKENHHDQDAFIRNVHWALYRTIDFDPFLFGKAYDRHYYDVRYYFAGSSRVLFINICGGDGWKKLCKFLNKPIPDIPFPHNHKS